jgi:hypothetical protein
METLRILRATRADRALLEAIQLSASVANHGDRDAVLASPDAVSVPVE